MQYQKIINLSDDTTNQLSEFRAINWVEINDESQGTYNANSDIKFETSMIRSNLCDYSDAYIHVNGTIAVRNTSAAAAPVKDINKKVILKKCVPFTNCISGMNNTQVYDPQDIDIVMPMYNLIEYSDVYLKTSLYSIKLYTGITISIF